MSSDASALKAVLDAGDLAAASLGREVQMKASQDSFSSAEWLSADGTNISLICQRNVDCLNVNFQYCYADAVRQL